MSQLLNQKVLPLSFGKSGVMTKQSKAKQDIANAVKGLRKQTKS
jgi:hypothetical protein